MCQSHQRKYDEPTPTGQFSKKSYWRWKIFLTFALPRCHVLTLTRKSSSTGAMTDDASRCNSVNKVNLITTGFATATKYNQIKIKYGSVQWRELNENLTELQNYRVLCKTAPSVQNVINCSRWSLISTTLKFSVKLLRSSSERRQD